MELKDICVDYEWAVKLKEAGYPQDNSYACIHISGEKVWPREDLLRHKFKDRIWEYWIPAPTTDELLGRLPPHIISEHPDLKENKDCTRKCKLGIVNHNGVMSCNYSGIYNNQEYTKGIYTRDKKLCNALAELWLYLKKNNLLQEG